MYVLRRKDDDCIFGGLMVVGRNFYFYPLPFFDVCLPLIIDPDPSTITSMLHVTLVVHYSIGYGLGV